MSSVNGITTVNVGKIQAVGSRTPAAAERDPAQSIEPERDKATGQPVPPRFPWLSRITRELERASNHAPPYSPAPLLGEHLDKSA